MKPLFSCVSERNVERNLGLPLSHVPKAQEYMAKDGKIFWHRISSKKEEDKSEGKQLKDVPIVRDFPEVFPEDLLGLPLTRPVEFHIDLIPGAAPVARAPYRLAPSKMKEFVGTHYKSFPNRLQRPSSRLGSLEKLYAKFFKQVILDSEGTISWSLIDSRGNLVDPAKIESIKDWASPKIPMEIR
ncbi:hypothetical protein Tco_0581196 [Tanacetum coccineum]